MKERSAIIWSLAAAGAVWEAIVQEQEMSHESDAGIYYLLGCIVEYRPLLSDGM